MLTRKLRILNSLQTPGNEVLKNALLYLEDIFSTDVSVYATRRRYTFPRLPRQLRRLLQRRDILSENYDDENMDGDQQDNSAIRHGDTDSKLVRVIRAVLLGDSYDSDSLRLVENDDGYHDSGLYHHPEIMPCSDKCNCSLLDAISSLKERILDQARILSEMDSVNGEARCNVKLTNSEERLFGRSIKSDSTVCYILIRELRAQRQDLKDMTNRWVEFINMADRLALKFADIRNRLVADLLPTLESMASRLSDIERGELADEESRQQDRLKYLKRMEERYETLKRAADRYVEAEDQDHVARTLRRSKDDQREKERIKDRSALKFALKRMMHLMGAPKPLKISDPPRKPIRRKMEPLDETSSLPVLRSLNNIQISFIRFINTTRRNVGVYWIDYQGQAIRYKVLSYRDHLDVNTFVTHPWIFVDEETRDRFRVNCSEVFFPEAWTTKYEGMRRQDLPSRIDRTYAYITLPLYTLRDLSMRAIKKHLRYDHHAFLLDIPRSLQYEVALMPPRKNDPSEL